VGQEAERVLQVKGLAHRYLTPRRPAPTHANASTLEAQHRSKKKHVPKVIVRAK
jgi:hypothetical protein